MTAPSRIEEIRARATDTTCACKWTPCVAHMHKPPHRRDVEYLLAELDARDKSIGEVLQSAAARTSERDQARAATQLVEQHLDTITKEFAAEQQRLEKTVNDLLAQLTRLQQDTPRGFVELA